MFFVVITGIIFCYGVYGIFSDIKEKNPIYDRLSFVNAWLIVMMFFTASCLFFAVKSQNYAYVLGWGGAFFAVCSNWLVNFVRLKKLKKILIKHSK